MDWMREMWTPISRWMPEHSMQVKMPKLVESHLGSKNIEEFDKMHETDTHSMSAGSTAYSCC